MDTSKEILELKKLLSELKNEINKILRSSRYFGGSLTALGNLSSDLTLQTKGKVKILFGLKFIDLIKDGKINNNFKFIYNIDTLEDISNKDGLYITNDNTVYLKSGDTVINITGEIGTTYVSFLTNLETTSELKYNALTNIGFIYSSLDQINESSLLNGIVYIEAELKLYIVSNGTLSEYTVNILNPYTKQFIISKEDESLGAIVIIGEGINNSLAFNNFYIYSSGTDSILEAENSLIFRINEKTIAILDKIGLVINNKVLCNTFLSTNATETSGFRLYYYLGQSTLEIDNLIVRNKINIPSLLYPLYWWTESNVVSALLEELNNGYLIQLKYPHNLGVGDVLYSYVDILDNESYINTLVTLNVTEINENYITVSSDSENIYELLLGKILFKINVSPLIKISPKGLDIIVNEELHTRIGNLEELLLSYLNNGNLSSINDIIGIYTKNAIFNTAMYSSLYDLLLTDNSSKIASTEWVHKILPKGSIIMFNGESSEIPEGWTICDGTNGTPNLIDKFIKASASSGQVGGNNEITLTIDNLPSHTHTIESDTITTSTDGEHSHVYNTVGIVLVGLDFIGTGSGIAVEAETTSSGGEHHHTLDVSGVTLSSTGNNKPIKIEPSYYSLIFIMKIVG